MYDVHDCVCMCIMYFVIVKKGNRCSVINKWINKLWYIETLGYPTAVKVNCIYIY